MITLPGFDIEHEVARFDGHRVYRVIRQSDHKRFLLKTIGDADRQGASESLRAESLNFQRLEVEGLARVTQVTEVEGEIALLFEDGGGQPLDQLLSLGPLEPIQVLRYARALAFTLAGLHRHGFMHRDIRPCHIWVNRETGLVELTGLGQASQVPREWHALGLWGRVKGRLAYMSPEQTGRVNRAEDYRTDFYSLGATLFEMMTGRVPFETADPLALVHAHMAQPVVSASDVNPAVPEVLSDIVRRLMAKEPADRYQGGLGLQRDLDLCLGELESTGEVRPFEIGQRDPPARFELPQGLYGREAERARLVHGLDEASRAGVSMLLVSGDPGVGKTALVEELRQEVLRRHGLYAYGKYREGQREIPYSGLFEALRKMVDQLLALEPSEIETYRTELSAALGEKLGVMVDLLPGLQAIVSDVPPVHTLGPAESKARFQLSLTQFLGFLTARDRSVALVLDDLQWVDAVSLELIEHCLEANVGNLLLVGTYRANEVDDVHPLSTTVSRLRKQGARLEEITVRPLDLEHVRSFVADTFRAETMETERLAQIVYDATAGNPLDIRLFVRVLHRDGLVRLLPTGGWTWRESATGAASGGKPVSDLADHSLTQLPEAARRTLSLAAALGDPFPVQALAAVCEQTVASTESALIDGCRLGILSKEDKIYRFAHDRFRETAYRLISHKHRHQAHLKIGRLLSRHATRDELASDVFGIVRHLNLAEAIVTDRTERDVASRMNLDAGRKAKVSGGFASAFQYFSKGLAFLAEDSWSSAYDLTLALTCETAEAAFLMGQFAEANRLVAAAIEGATTVLDKVRAYETKIAVAHAQGKEKEALGHAFEILEQLGLHLPHDPTRDEAVELATTASLTIEPLLSTEPAELRLMTDPSMGAAMRVLARAIVVAGWSNYDLLVAIESTFVKLTVEHGHAPESVLAYVGIADWRCRYLGDYEGGRRAGERGLALVPVLGAEIYQAHGDFLFTLGVTSWLEDEHRVGEDLATAYMGARRAGNLIASSSGLFRCHAGFYSGVRLEKVEKLIAEYHAQALGAGHERVVAELDRLQEQIKRFTLPRVTGTRHGPRPLLRDRASDRQRLASRSPAIMWKPAVARGQVTLHLANLCHDMMAHVLWRRSEEAYRIARHAPSPSESPPRGLTPYSFWLGLSLLDGCSKLGGEDKEAVVAT
ncbi:MAG: AAA family ATPase, partial [Gemmatimonadota bacterium]